MKWQLYRLHLAIWVIPRSPWLLGEDAVAEEWTMWQDALRLLPLGHDTRRHSGCAVQLVWWGYPFTCCSHCYPPIQGLSPTLKSCQFSAFYFLMVPGHAHCFPETSPRNYCLLPCPPQLKTFNCESRTVSALYMLCLITHYFKIFTISPTL